MKQLYILLLVISCALIFGCHKSDNIYYQQIGREITINFNNLPLLNKHLLDSQYIYNRYNEKWKIIAVLEMGCPSCVEDVYKWDSMINKNEEFKNTQFIIILIGEYSEYSYFHLVKNKSFTFPIFWDKNNLFVRSNQIGYIELEKSILLNEENKIVFIGSPLNNKNIEKSYRKIIK